MNFLKKFYDTAEAEVGGGEVNIAELMAKSGYNSDNRPAPQVQVEDKGNNEQTKKTEVEAQTAKVGEETKVENVVQEAEKPKEVVEQVQEQPKVEEKPQATITWQEVLKQQQPDTVLKELLGVDDSKIGLLNTVKDLPPQLVGLIDTWKANGDLSTYLKEMVTDYSKMSSEDVMRSQLRLEYPKASDAAINAIFKKEVIDAYQLNPDKYSEEEVAEGQLLLDAKADKYRETLQQRQQQFLIPKAPEPAAVVEQDNTEQQQQAAKFESYKAEVSNNPYIKDIFANKKLSIGTGAEQFNFPVEPSKLTDVLFDSDKWAATMFDKGLDEKGNVTYIPKTQHQALVAAVATYGMDFMNEYAKHFKALGGKAVIDPIDNAKPVESQNAVKSQTQPATAAEAMAKHGQLR